MNILILLLSCNDVTVEKRNDEPEITILSPQRGDSFEEGETITFEAVASDLNDPGDGLEVRWESDLDGVLSDTFAATDGKNSFESTILSVGIHTITATVIDPEGAVGTDSRYIEVTDTADAPTIVWNHPTQGEQGMEGESFEFSVVVADNQDEPVRLQVFLSSDIDGEFCSPPPDQVGLSLCDATLSVGPHTLTATVVDTDNNETSVEAFFEVVAGTTVDDDLDGWTEDQGDCDDLDGSVHPTAQEVANGIDDNCDGLVDEGTDAFDDDGDCYCETAPCAGSIEAACGTLEGGDCDDDAEGRHPNATETCDSSDEDCDGSIDEGTTCVDDDNDGFTEIAGDCNDSDGTIRPGAPEVADGIDQDCDGQVDEGTVYFDDDGDCYCETAACTGSVNANCTQVDAGDCDDNDANTSPGAAELCNSLDDNCNGQTDENATNATTYYADSDGDLWGDASNTVAACAQPAGYVTNDDDCNDGSNTVNPSAGEVCNGGDDDCDGAIDEAGATGGQTSYLDNDGDTYGNPSVFSNDCTPPMGYVYDNTDCNDSDASTFPGGDEFCDNLDNDCDNVVDEADAIDALTWYVDSDGDSYGESGTVDIACDQPPGFVANRTDCDDSDATINPGASESCDGIDEDCDGLVDDGAAPTWYRDSDGDGYGNANFTQVACSQPSGFVSNGNDCDDTDSAISPVTNWYRDADGDTYGTATSISQSCTQPVGYVSNSGDCNDNVSTDNPLGTEACDGRDNDCDGSTDEANATGCTNYYPDYDGDGFGDTNGAASCQCSGSGYYTTTNKTDCYDSNASAYPGAAGWHQNSRGDGNYDWNCDGSQEKRWTAAYSCSSLCTSYTSGWTGGTPACGGKGTYQSGCSVTFSSPFCTYSTSTANSKQECR